VEVEHGVVGEVARGGLGPHEVYMAMASGDGDAPHAGRQSIRSASSLADACHPCWS
jgi:hypothetical protein